MRFFSFLLLLFIMLPPAVQADKVGKYKPPRSFEVTEDFYIIEGAGLLQSGSEDALDVNMWDGSDRADVTELLKTMPANSRSLMIRDLIETTLLSESNTNKLDDYEDVTAGEDLLTLRIHKLMEAGFYKDALELYSVAIETPHHQDIAKAGILAMLGSGEKSIACLEMKTLGNMNMSDPFWPAFMAYCNYTLSDTPSEPAQKVLEKTRYDIIRSVAFNPNFVFPYSVEDWANLDVLEKNVLIAEQKIEAPSITAELLSKIPPQDIAVLLQLGTLRGDDYLSTLFAAYEWGLADAQDIEAAYKNFDSDSQVAGKLPSLYSKLIETDEPEAISSILTDVIKTSEDHAYASLVPFAPFFADHPVSELSSSEVISLLRLFYFTDVNVTPEIFQNYTENYEKSIDHDDFSIIIEAIPLVLKLPESHEFMKNIQNISIFHKDSQSDAENVIENLDKGYSDVDNAEKVYEKDVDVAMQNGQEDAQAELLRRLNKLSKRDAQGETALLSIKLLSDQSIREADQDIYSDSLEALKSVNLKEFSRKMAIERLIGD